MEKTVWRLRRRKEIVTAPITLPRLDTATLAELRRRYEETPDVESRTRYQMILLARQAYTVPQIARIVLRSEDTVARVLNRFEAGRAGRAAPGHITRPRAEGHSSVGSREARMVLEGPFWYVTY
jgi:Winged helix-turn helix